MDRRGQSGAAKQALLLAAALQDCARAFAEKLGRRADVAGTLVNKGLALWNLKRLEEALACYDRAIENYEELVGAGRCDLRENVATALMNKGVSIDDLYRLEEALDWYDRAIEK